MRRRKFFLNTLVAILQEFVALLCAFILPRQMLLYFGSEVNGLVASITQFLGFITLLDMGVGAVVQSTLYKPLAQRNDKKISAIVITAKKFFKRIALILFVYSIFLMIAYPTFVNDSLGYISTVVLIGAISVNAIAQYFFGITNQLLLNAYQKSYIQILTQMSVTILNTIVSVILIQSGFSIIIVKLTSSLVLLIRPIVLSFYVQKNYVINNRLNVEKDPLTQKWSAMAQHISTFVFDKTDTLVLTLFSTLTNISIYFVYYIVVNGLCRVFLIGTTGLQALFGDMYAKNEKENLENIYNFFEWVTHTVIIFMFACAGILILPFVSVYTEGINDANYEQPIFAMILVIAFTTYSLHHNFSGTFNLRYFFKHIMIDLSLSYKTKC